MLKKLLTSSKVYISKSGIPDAGRGVYARRDIKKGEIVERCPIIEVPKHDMSNLKESILVAYFFYFGKNKERLAIALGFGSIYNHSDKPNVAYKVYNFASSAYKVHNFASSAYKVKPREKVIDFIALDDIKKDKEITFNYSGHNNSKDKKRPLWFEV